MSSKLLQIKVDADLKEKLKRIALSKGLNISSYVKTHLIEAIQKDEDLALTENGFTLREERRLLRSLEEGEREYREKKLKKYSSVEEALNSLRI